ncbi:MAG TPA: protein phosphatase 2C domain-containing protein [Aggregatilinea sp.]|uniref:PP2C family protein-serine/threonine phosphatase n=1 Tax=Aggregatilinea sp. TaxID=2806333 RepID=UPI002B89230D|nr:protein phosphatase 2C domain-containing protein [Aggregatilinea sp.]HML23327.1 protein phosphatase 2C domain-containing protein [Aggregatilinea sp.]
MGQTPSLLLDVSVAMDTDPGRQRKGNQDAIGQMVPSDPETRTRLGQLFVLADGVGGLSGGDLAAQYAVSTIISSYYEQEKGDPQERLARAIAEANQVIYAEGQDQETPRTIATTVVAAVIRGRELIVGNVGDSPAFLMRDASARKLTTDHTVETMRREAGLPVDEHDPAGRKLARVLGNAPTVKVDIISGPVRDGDCVVLCSDGLTRYLEPEEIEQTAATLSPSRSVKALIQMANERGGADNISVIVLRLSDDAVPAGAAASSLDAWDLSAPDQPHAETGLAPLPERTTGNGVSAARARRRERELRRQRGELEDNPLTELWKLLRGNTVSTLAALVVLLVVFFVIMLLVNNLGGDDEPRVIVVPGGTEEAPASGGSNDLTATARAINAATAQAQAMQTNDAIQVQEANRAATSAALTLTPAPPSGPQMVKDTWFRVLDGDPIPTFTDANISAEAATALDAGSAYLVQEVDSTSPNGPWYWVVDNLGSELRWVNGPSLHQRIVAISASGDPLPDDQQPQDIAPRDAATTPQPLSLPPASSTEAAVEGTEPPTEPTPTSAIPYAAEVWEAGVTVAVKEDLALRDIPSLLGMEVTTAVTGETGTIVQGPSAADGHWWWQVRFDEERIGWVAQPLLGYAG